MGWRTGMRHTPESIERMKEVHGTPPPEQRRAKMAHAASFRVPVRRPAIDRLLARVVTGEGCWNWTGSAMKEGYGVIQVGTHDHPRTETVHRVMWEATNGSIPPGRDISHLCHNRLCCNPAHLMLATRAENMAASVRDGWPNGNRSRRGEA